MDPKTSTTQTDDSLDPLEQQDLVEDEAAELATVTQTGDDDDEVKADLEEEEAQADALDKLALPVSPPAVTVPVPPPSPAKPAHSAHTAHQNAKTTDPAKKNVSHGISQALIDAPLKIEDWYDEGHL